ncbi:MAG: DUF4097 domain-containing protein [Clostridia bacterium]|nr:DUF4097 domain-containing protein [Clostridia bacterium]
MKKQSETVILPTDAKRINFDVFGGEIEIKRAAAFSIDSVEGDFRIERKSSQINVTRQKKPVIVGTKAKITMFVPEGLVPDINIKAKYSNVDIDAGTYGAVYVEISGGRMTAKDATAESFSLKGDDTGAELAGVTVKKGVFASLSDGGILLSGGRVPRVDLSVKGGNIGVWESDFDSMELYSSKGNIQTTLKGREEDYTFRLSAKDGLVNREDTSLGSKVIKAHASHGNVYMDFSYMRGKEKKKNDDDVAKNLGRQVGA